MNDQDNNNPNDYDNPNGYNNNNNNSSFEDNVLNFHLKLAKIKSSTEESDELLKNIKDIEYLDNSAMALRFRVKIDGHTKNKKIKFLGKYITVYKSRSNGYVAIADGCNSTECHSIRIAALEALAKSANQEVVITKLRD